MQEQELQEEQELREALENSCTERAGTTRPRQSMKMHYYVHTEALADTGTFQ